jgi:uncharacterized membrane protein
MDTTENYTDSAALVSFFSALCLFLAAVEYAIPKPLPFMRIGLANLPVMLSLPVMKKRDTLLLILFKVFAQALISGTLFSYVFVFSAAGSFASGFAMIGLYGLSCRSGKISNIGLSLAGALANNGAQIAVARIMVFGENTRYIAPVLLGVGCVTGLALGLFANVFCMRSEWYKQLFVLPEYAVHSVLSVRPAADRAEIKKSRIEFIVALICFPVFLMIRDTRIVWLCTLVFFCMSFIKRQGKMKIVPSLFMVFFVTLFALFSPFGKVVFSFGKLRVTLGALESGLHKSGILVGMVFLSQFAVSPRLELPGKAGIFLRSVFSVFDELTVHHISFHRGQVIAALDDHLFDLWNRL